MEVLHQTDVIHERLGAKAADGQTVNMDQSFTVNVVHIIYPGKRWTWWRRYLFAKVEGVVRFERKGRDKNKFLLTPLLNKKVQ